MDKYCPDGYEFGTYEEITIYYDRINNPLHPTSRSDFVSSRSDSFKGISSITQFEDAFFSRGIRYDIRRNDDGSDDSSNSDDDSDDNDVVCCFRDNDDMRRE